MLCLLLASPAFSRELANDTYRVRLQPGGAIEVTSKDVAGARIFTPTFTVLSREDDPKFTSSVERELAYRIPNWNALSNGEPTRIFFEAGKAATVTVTVINHTTDEAVGATLEISWNSRHSTAPNYPELGRQLGLAIERFLRGERDR